MTFFRNMFYAKSNFLSANPESSLACPNCWGVQEYGGCYVELLPDQTKANINGDVLRKKTFVQQFVETYVTGIKLRKRS
ncbi:hypothetical protein [Neolewinella agarilytica]|uniref:Uncharacterized protein n=1 Tax=Neolewinella agarilytica TaxID=478744 RepID=A0A1H9JUV8_9BACT|nr:hypothetical protein [Neolewinella agarilytica]SEQ90608.1 hypothetical protein SAMN05444359_11882 [Neolewinella agarilytica]